MAPSALLDANVLYPAPIRDLLLHLATLRVFQPKWTHQIQDEWVRNILKNRPDLSAKSLQRTLVLMDQHFPDAQINGFEERIESIQLPDRDDRHVLAAAIHNSVDFIVTENMRDFPLEALRPCSIIAITSDDFINLITKENDKLLMQAFDAQVHSLTNPIKTAKEVLTTLKQARLVKSSGRIEEIIHRQI